MPQETPLTGVPLGRIEDWREGKSPESINFVIEAQLRILSLETSSEECFHLAQMIARIKTNEAVLQQPLTIDEFLADPNKYLEGA